MKVVFDLSYFTNREPGVQIDRTWPTLKKIDMDFEHEEWLSDFLSWRWAGLEGLRMVNCDLDVHAASIASAFEAGRFPMLRKLSFKCGPDVKGSAIKVLFRSPLVKLESLRLSGFDLEVAFALVDCAEHLPALQLLKFHFLPDNFSKDINFYAVSALLTGKWRCLKEIVFDDREGKSIKICSSAGNSELAMGCLIVPSSNFLNR